MLGFKPLPKVSALWKIYDISAKACVTIALGVLRMVKLFGWEQKMSKTLKEKREEELVWIWRDKVR